MGVCWVLVLPWRQSQLDDLGLFPRRTVVPNFYGLVAQQGGSELARASGRLACASITLPFMQVDLLTCMPAYFLHKLSCMCAMVSCSCSLVTNRPWPNSVLQPRDWQQCCPRKTAMATHFWKTSSRKLQVFGFFSHGLFKNWTQLKGKGKKITRASRSGLKSETLLDWIFAAQI